MRVTFFRVAERKSPKKGRPYTLRPFASLRATCGARGQRGLARTRCTALRSDNREPLSAGRCAPRRILKGTRGTDIHTGHCFAALRSAPPRGRKRHALRRLGRAKQWPVWMFGCPTPCWLRLRRGGCGVSMGVAAPMPRNLTRRGCPSGARSAKRVPRRTPQPPRRRLPRSNAKGSQTGGRLFFGDFLLATQKKVTRMPGDSRPLPSAKARHPNQRSSPGFDRLSPNGWGQI